MTQLEIIDKLFRDNNGFVNNRMLRDELIHYSGRNRIYGYRDTVLAAKGKTLKPVRGKTWLDNGWEVVDASTTVFGEDGQGEMFKEAM